MKTAINRSALAMIVVLAALNSTTQAQQTPPSPPVPKVVTFKVDVTLTRMEGDTPLGSSPFSLLVNTGGSVRTSDNTGRASLRIGVDVPSGSQTRTSPSTGTSTTDTVFKHVGTQIDAYVTQFDDSRYAVDVSINDTAIFDGTVTERLAQAQRTLDLASQKHARQKELFAKNLVTRANMTQAENELFAAQAAVTAAKQGGQPIGRADQMAFRSFTSSNRVYLRDGESQEMTVATDRTSGETIKAAVKLTVVK